MRRLAVISGLLGAVLGVVSQVPLAWAVEGGVKQADPEAAAHGTVWDGTLAHIDGLPPISTRLRGTTMSLSADAHTLRLAAAASPQAIRDVSLSLPIATLARFDTRMQGLLGEVRLVADEIVIRDGACTSASGTAFTDVLAVNAANWEWRGPELSGPISCEDGSVVVAMNGSDASGQVTARVAISPSGPYRTDITMSGLDPRASAVLPLFGFQPAGGGSFTLRESGAWN